MATPSPPPSLLLFPVPPRPVPRRRLAAAYRAPLTAVLTRLSREHAQQEDEVRGPAPVLVVAVVGSFIRAETAAESDAGARASRGPSSVRWRAAQSLLARLYTLIACVCAERDIAAHLGSHEPGSVDARVVLVHRHDCREGRGPSTAHGMCNSTAILDLATFAAQLRPWAAIFHASDESGLELLAAFLAHAGGGEGPTAGPICGVDGGVASTDALPPEEDEEAEASRRATEDAVQGYATVCLGGTFDHLHPGHKLLLEAAALLLAVPDAGAEPCSLIVGISGDALLTKKEYAAELQPWSARAQSVVAVLATMLGCAPPTAATASELRTTLRDGRVLVRCVDIGDAFGPTVTEERIGAIVVSGETRGGGDAINQRRAARAWAALDVYEIDVLDATGADDERGAADRLAAKISSTAIRRREMAGRGGAAAADRRPTGATTPLS